MASLQTRNDKANAVAVKPFLVGAMSALGSYMYVSRTAVVLPFWYPSGIPLYMFHGMAGVGSSMLAEVAHAWILPHISNNNKLANMEAMVLSPVMNGVAMNLITRYAGSENILKNVGMGNSFIVGAGAEIIGHYAFETLLKT